MTSTNQQRQPRRPRGGLALNELIVAGALLIVGMGVSLRGYVACGQLWQDTRHQQLALDELAGHLERLAALEPNQRSAALQQLQPSAAVAQQLPGARLIAQVEQDADGERVLLGLQWDRRGDPPPVRLCGWLTTTDAADAVEGETR